MTLDFGIYEYVQETGEVIERFPRQPKADTYVFMSVDENGSIGPRGRLYVGSARGAGTSGAGIPTSKTGIVGIDTADWSYSWLNRNRVFNRVIYGNWTALSDPLGHYMWGMAIHSTLPKFLAYGITSSSPFLWTGCLGSLPTNDPPISNAGVDEFREGKRNHRLGLSSIFGFNYSGDIGFSADEWRGYATWSEGREAVRARLDPLFHPNVSEAEREAVAKEMFAQRTRKHYQ
jgi:hypothetical protein